MRLLESRSRRGLIATPVFVLEQIAQNALAPVLIPLVRSRGSLGMDGDVDAVLETLDSLAHGLAGARVDLDGARTLELGPGRTPELTVALALAGAREALGLDVVRQVPEDADRPERYRQLVDALAGPRGQVFLDAVGADAGTVRRRFGELRDGAWPARFAAFSGAEIPLADGSVDLVVSKSVLEHVPRRAVPVLVCELLRVLAPGGVMVHVVDFRDHFHLIGDEGVRGDWLDALRYPQTLFDLMLSNRSNSINRLRAHEWRELLEREGFAIEGWFEKRFPLAPTFDRRRLRRPWRDLPRSELEVGMVCLAARRPPGVSSTAAAAARAARPRAASSPAASPTEA